MSDWEDDYDDGEDWNEEDFDDEDRYVGPWMSPGAFRRMISERASERASAEASAAHARHLRSEKWQKIRLAELAQADYECDECGKRNCRLEVHHVTYTHFGHEENHRGTCGFFVKNVIGEHMDGFLRCAHDT